MCVCVCVCVREREREREREDRGEGRLPESGISSLVPRLLPAFQHCVIKTGEPGKTYHMRDIRWNQTALAQSIYGLERCRPRVL